MTARAADDGLPVVRVRRIGDRRSLVRRCPWFEVELTPVGAVRPAWVQESGDPQSLLESYLGVGDAHAVVAAASRDANDGSAPWRTLFPGDERVGVMGLSSRSARRRCVPRRGRSCGSRAGRE